MTRLVETWKEFPGSGSLGFIRKPAYTLPPPDAHDKLTCGRSSGNPLFTTVLFELPFASLVFLAVIPAQAHPAVARGVIHAERSFIRRKRGFTAETKCVPPSRQPPPPT